MNSDYAQGLVLIALCTSVLYAIALIYLVITRIIK